MTANPEQSANPAAKNQTRLLLGLVAVNAILAVIYYLVAPVQTIPLPGGGPGGGTSGPDVPPWVLGLANAVIVLVIYSIAGLAGLWFARRLGLPGTYRPDAGWKGWVLWPLLAGILVGLFIVLVDRLFTPAIRAALAPTQDWQGFSHPEFPLSLIASATAGIGEEILFRSFVLGFWAFLLNLLLRRWNATRLALWIANLIAAVAFAASHIATATLLVGVATPADLPPAILAELLLLNGVLGLVAGGLSFRDGLVAAIGVHFWADIVWHTLYPLIK
jgi:membrane protease YdiL (CAAX protease family)